MLRRVHQAGLPIPEGRGPAELAVFLATGALAHHYRKPLLVAGMVVKADRMNSGFPSGVHRFLLAALIDLLNFGHLCIVTQPPDPGIFARFLRVLPDRRVTLGVGPTMHLPLEPSSVYWGEAIALSLQPNLCGQ